MIKILMGVAIGLMVFMLGMWASSEPKRSEWKRCLEIAESKPEAQRHRWEVVCAQIYLLEEGQMQDGI